MNQIIHPFKFKKMVRVVDNRIPEVHINGPAEISEFDNILTGQENYFDYGAYASEDLEADGHVSWMESVEDDWSVQLEEAEYKVVYLSFFFEKFAFLTALQHPLMHPLWIVRVDLRRCRCPCNCS